MSEIPHPFIIETMKLFKKSDKKDSIYFIHLNHTNPSLNKDSEEYKKVIERGHGDNYVYTQLADSYYNIFSTEEAEEFYAKVLENSEDSEYMYRYSQMLKANGKYDQSNECMEKFSAKVPEDNRAIAFRKTPTYINKILDKGQRFNIQNADFNSEYSDFGGSFQGRQLYFTSARNTSRKSYGWNDQPFLDIYTVAKNEDGTFNKAKTIGSPVNSKYHDFGDDTLEASKYVSDKTCLFCEFLLILNLLP